MSPRGSKPRTATAKKRPEIPQDDMLRKSVLLPTRSRSAAKIRIIAIRQMWEILKKKRMLGFSNISYCFSSRKGNQARPDGGRM